MTKTRNRYLDDADLPPLTEVPLTDIRSYTRRSAKVDTMIYVTIPDRQGLFTRHQWIRCGEVELRKHGDARIPFWEIGARLGQDATDFEHDSAWAFKLPLIAVEFDSLEYGKTVLRAWVAPHEVKASTRSFRVPRPGWNPLELPETEKCADRECGHRGHPIVPEGLYAGPPFDKYLYNLVRGCPIEIKTGAAYDEPDEDL